MPKRGKPSVRLNRGHGLDLDNAAKEFWADVLECDELAHVVRLVRDSPRPKPAQLRLAEFVLTLSIPPHVPADEVKRWNRVIERCAKTTGREALGVYRAVIAARLATM